DFGFELTGFSDADYAGCKDTFKSTSSGAQFLGEKLVSWSSKKQGCTALSTAEAEYVSGLDLTYASSTITKQQSTEGELDLLFEAMYDDYFGGQPSASMENVSPVQEPQDVDELNPNSMINGNTFVNPFANSSTSAAEAPSSSQN
nr:Gag-Pol polyprotein [Tanacetum cinerariifolium]